MMELSDLKEKFERMARLAPYKLRVKAEQSGSAVGAPTHGLQERTRELFDLCFKGQPDFRRPDITRLVRLDVGDRTAELGYDVHTSLPVASDVWYLAISASILPFQGDDYRADADEIIAILRPMMDALGGVAPLRSIQQYSDLTRGFDAYTMHNYVASSAPYVIREARYETWLMNRNTEYPSDGSTETSEYGRTKTPDISEGQLYGGLISFPVGPMGVMEVLSLWSETMPFMMSAGRDFAGAAPISFPTGWQVTTAKSLDGLMSPMTDMQGQCPGVHLVEQGYRVVHRDCEYPAADVGNSGGVAPFGNFRFYLHRDAQWPVPGEFVALLAKPWPTHVWWFQETSPIFYSGNWIETAHYTSGTVLEVCEPDDGSLGKIYRVNVRGCEMYLAATDFYEYEVGDRVAIIKITELDRNSDTAKGNYLWSEMENMIQRRKAEEQQADRPTVVTDSYRILPVSFYEQEV